MEQLREGVQNILDQLIPERVKLLKRSQGSNRPLAPLRRRRETTGIALFEKFYPIFLTET